MAVRRDLRRARRSAKTRGAVAVEFGLIAPLFILLVFGVIDFGWMLNRNTMLTNIARDAARSASLGNFSDGTSGVLAQIDDDLDSNNISDATRTVSCEKDGTTYSLLSSDATGSTACPAGATVTVTIAYHHQWLTPVASICSLFGGPCGDGGIDLDKKIEMVRE